MKNDKSIYITINHLDEFMATMNLRVGDVLTLKKDPDNIYDDESIVVYDKNGSKTGYVANSVHSVARGTDSAGRVYDGIDNESDCIVKFILCEEGCEIGELISLGKKEGEKNGND